MLLNEGIKTEDHSHDRSTVFNIAFVLLFIGLMIVSSGNGSDKEVDFDI